MAFEPLQRRSLADGVFDQLVDGIVGGELAEGGALPSERRLAEAFGVSRPAVREALQRLAQSGMVTIRQGESTRVESWRRSAGPDLLARLIVRPDGTPNLRVARSVLEVRLAVGPDIAALAAARIGSTSELRQRLTRAVDRLAEQDDPVELQLAALDFWDTLVDASENVAYRLMSNALSAAYVPLLEGLAHVMLAEVADTSRYRAIADAVLAGDDEQARLAARHLLEAGTSAVVEAIDAVEAATSGPDGPTPEERP